MQLLGATTEYDEHTGILKLKMTDKLRHRILGSKTFIPWSDGLVRAAFESVTDDGFILIKMKGRGATIGPLDPFLSACEQILWGVEGMSIDIESSSQPILVGSRKGMNRWSLLGIDHVKPAEVIEKIRTQDLVIDSWEVDSKQCLNAFTN
jgi:hypothetical protein